MTRRYAQLTQTDDVKARQEHHGVAEQAQRMADAPVEDTRLSAREADFITVAARPAS